jgi:UDP-glucose 4-epimerase
MGNRGAHHRANFLMAETGNVLLIGGCGYIGSYLHGRLCREGFRVIVVDQLRRGNPLGIEVIQEDYASLPSDFLSQFDAVLWFAGHSNVRDSVDDPSGAVANNCINLFALAKRLPERTKFIYASTGSLYSARSTPVVPATETGPTCLPSQNAYDMSKFALDYLASGFLKNFYGLRMGTVSGYSPNLRRGLVFNAMNIDAKTKGCVRLLNSKSSRTILFMDDLWALLRKLLATNQTPGFYNVGSISLTLGELASAVAGTWGARVIDEGETDTYSFRLDTTRMRKLCGSDLVDASLSSRCREFIHSCGAELIES